MNSFWSGFEKKAEEKEPTWWQKQKGMTRAIRRSDEGFGKILADKELVKSRVKHSLPRMLIGGTLGAGAGALLHKSDLAPLIGGSLGLSLGQSLGMSKADKAYLKNKGIDSRWGGFNADFSPEAKKKYIDDHEKKAEYSEQQVEDMLHGKARQKKKSGFLSSNLKGGTLGALLGAGAGGALAWADLKKRGRFDPQAIKELSAIGATGGMGLGGLKGIFNAAHNNKVNNARDTLMNQGPDRSERIMAHSPDNFWSRYNKSDMRDLPFENR